jgi:type IV pilus assembly protein PilE
MAIFMKKNKGFTLIELLIVITIIGILTIIVLPTYQEYIRTANRTVAQLTLTRLAHEFERTSARQGNYSTFVMGDEDNDTYAITAVSDDDTFTITATPVAGSTNDGDKCGALSINQAGVTEPADCWN